MNFKEKVTILFENATFGFRETDAKGRKIYSTLQLAFFTIICSTIVFVVTAGLSYNITRKKAMKDANTLMAENMDIATEIIHRHVQNVEHSGYSLSSIFSIWKLLTMKMVHPTTNSSFVQQTAKK